MEISSLPPFTPLQRRWSRRVWISVLAVFLAAELPGAYTRAPWRTLSETSWDLEREHASTRPLLFGFLLGLAFHIRYRLKFWRSIAAGVVASEATRQLWGA